MFTPVKVAAISMRPTKWDKAGNADRLEATFRKAASDGPALLVAPEGVLEGYVVMDVVEGRESADAMLEIAEPIEGPYIARFRSLARELRTCLCFGFAERIDGDAYDAAVFIDHEGRIRGKYHKTQLAEGTHSTWYFNRLGSRLRAFDTPLGRVGVLICNDRWNPLIARTLVLDGAQLLLIPSYGSKARDQNAAVLARARENGVPVVEANVGMNLIISKGEAIAYKWGYDQITTAVVEVPVRPSTEAARELERHYLKLQGPEAARRYRKTRDQLKRKGAASIGIPARAPARGGPA